MTEMSLNYSNVTDLRRHGVRIVTWWTCDIMGQNKRRKKMIRRINLQLFSDEGNTSGAGQGEGSGANTPNNTEPLTFDEFLKQDDNQAEFDRRMTKAVNTAVANAQDKWKKLTDNKLTEAEKLAQMSREERAEYRSKQLEKELASYKEREAVAEMSKTARKMLSDSGISISDELLSVMVTTDAEETKNAVEGFINAFNEAVEAAVKDRVKGNPPRKGSGSSPAPMTKEQILAIKDTDLRQLKMLENKELFGL